eukprot:2184554-Pyramimonas_sp.AAC.1
MPLLEGEFLPLNQRARVGSELRVLGESTELCASNIWASTFASRSFSFAPSNPTLMWLSMVVTRSHSSSSRAC